MTAPKKKKAAPGIVGRKYGPRRYARVYGTGYRAGKRAMAKKVVLELLQKVGA